MLGRAAGCVRWTLLLWLLMSSGCTTHTQRITRIRQAYYANDLGAADGIIAESLKKNSGETDLLKLDRAILSLAAGKPTDSERVLREVRDSFDNHERALLNGSAKSYLTDDTGRVYPGEDYEKVLIRAFLALSNLMHDGGDAEAYSLQLIDKQEQIIASGADQQGQNPKSAYQRVALAPYLRGVLREATHLNYDDAQRSYVAVVNWQPTFQAGKNDLARASNGRHSSQGNGVLYVFAMTGRGPFKKEMVETPSTAALAIAGQIVSVFGKQSVPPTMAPVKVPKVVAQPNTTRAVEVAINARPVGTTETITDVTQLAVQQYEAIYPQVIARAVARRCVKKGVVYGTKEMSGMSKGSLSSLAFDLAGAAWEATESADTRCWGLLPDKIQVLRLELPAGEHDLALRAVAAPGRATSGSPPVARRIRVADSRNTYVLANFPDQRLVGEILVSEP